MQVAQLTQGNENGHILNNNTVSPRLLVPFWQIHGMVTVVIE
jgi:hypothetical protein